MNSQFLLEKLKNSKEYQEFIKENKDAYLCSGFFTIDIDNREEGNQYHLDFFSPLSGKTFSFELEKEVRLVPIDRYGEQFHDVASKDGVKLGERVLERVEMKNHFDFEWLEKIISAEMEMQKVKNKIQKMIFSLQNLEGRDMLLGTIFVSGFGIVKANVDLKEKRVTDFEKKSFWDMLNVMRK